MALNYPPRISSDALRWPVDCIRHSSLLYVTYCFGLQSDIGAYFRDRKPALPDEFLIEIRALRQDPLSPGALVSISPVDLKRDAFSAEVCCWDC